MMTKCFPVSWVVACFVFVVLAGCQATPAERQPPSVNQDLFYWIPGGSASQHPELHPILQACIVECPVPIERDPGAGDLAETSWETGSVEDGVWTIPNSIEGGRPLKIRLDELRKAGLRPMCAKVPNGHGAVAVRFLSPFIAGSSRGVKSDAVEFFIDTRSGRVVYSMALLCEVRLPD